MNYRKIFIAISCIFFLFVISCIDDMVSSSPDGSYKYTAYDSLGTIVSKGWLKIEIKDSSNVTGSWEINKVGNPQNIGPQTGNGELEGSFNNGKLVLGLNPDFVDNNVGLVGTHERNKYTGKWYYSSFIGLTNWGSFEAERK